MKILILMIAIVLVIDILTEPKPTNESDENEVRKY